jgi:hypothetical protein
MWERLNTWAQFPAVFGEPTPNGWLGDAVRGFFENEGRVCYVLPLDKDVGMRNALGLALELLEATSEVDLVCAPDVVAEPDATELQCLLLEHCDRMENRFAILDAPRDVSLAGAVSHWRKLSGRNGALYFPFIGISRSSGSTAEFVPPCGHIAGVYSRVDSLIGAHKAPANEELNGVVDLLSTVSTEDQAKEDPQGVVNCVRAFAGRGMRVWGARTVSGESDWKYIPVRRLFLSAGRWIEAHLSDLVMEENDQWLWARVRRRLNDYLFKLFRAGVLQGQDPSEAYFVRCDGETTDATDIENGRLQIEIGLAPVVPAEFIVVRFVIGARGLTPVGIDTSTKN